MSIMFHVALIVTSNYYLRIVTRMLPSFWTETFRCIALIMPIQKLFKCIWYQFPRSISNYTKKNSYILCTLYFNSISSTNSINLKITCIFLILHQQSMFTKLEDLQRNKKQRTIIEFYSYTY